MKSQYIMEKGCLVVYVPRELDHHQANRIRTETSDRHLPCQTSCV